MHTVLFRLKSNPDLQNTEKNDNKEGEPVKTDEENTTDKRSNNISCDTEKKTEANKTLEKDKTNASGKEDNNVPSDTEDTKEHVKFY